MYDPTIKMDCSQKEDLNVLTVTWNMSHENHQNLNFELFLNHPQDHDLIILMFQESKAGELFREKLTAYMDFYDFKLLSSRHLYEMFLVVYLKKSKLSLISGPILTNYTR